MLWGEENADELSGGEDIDAIFGDDPTLSSGGFDGVDTIQGGNGQRHPARGEPATTSSAAAQGSDFGDGQGGTDTCSTTETGPC